MKRLFLSVTLIAATALMFTGCGNKNSNKAGGNDSVQAAADGADATAEAKDAAEGWPWDYPSDVKPDAKVGQTVLCPHLYADKIKNNKPNKEDGVYIYYTCKLLSLGDKTSKIETAGGIEYEIPNTLILPIPEGQTAKKGDIVLTWWQGGSGMQTAIVTDASDPAQPTAFFLGLNWKLKSDGTVDETFKRGAKLKPNSFFVLKDGEVSVGQRVRYYKKNDWGGDDEWAEATIVSISGDKALLCAFANTLKVAKLSDIKPIPFHQNIKAGDTVYGIFTSTFQKDYHVDKVDNKEGRVWVTTPHNDKKILNILQVLKSL